MPQPRQRASALVGVSVAAASNALAAIAKIVFLMESSPEPVRTDANPRQLIVDAGSIGLRSLRAANLSEI
jgi:hypothetical protein